MPDDSADKRNVTICGGVCRYAGLEVNTEILRDYLVNVFRLDLVQALTGEFLFPPFAVESVVILLGLLGVVVEP